MHKPVPDFLIILAASGVAFALIAPFNLVAAFVFAVLLLTVLLLRLYLPHR